MHEVLKVNICKPECNYNKKGKPGQYGIEKSHVYYLNTLSILKGEIIITKTALGEKRREKRKIRGSYISINQSIIGHAMLIKKKKN